MALLRSFANPLHRFVIIFGHSSAFGIHGSKVELSHGITKDDEAGGFV